MIWLLFLIEHNYILYNLDSENKDNEMKLCIFMFKMYADFSRF